MKRIAFCDKYIHYLAMPPDEEKDDDRLHFNERMMAELDKRYDLLKYPKFNIHRIRKDYPIDGIVTHITLDDSLNEEQELFYKAYPSEIKQAKEEFPEMKILAYTDREKGMDYITLMECGIDDVLWRDPEKYDEQIEIILKWVDG
ncbi:hypothetical protein GF361_00270 [Candidatus Woesearchaeota archaeon]|nr:hypothetical protein [Candidatus Woesearchaeota archaeon]